MAFDLAQVYGFGTGALKDVEVDDPELHDDFNSYAAVIAISGNTITLDLENASIGVFEKFSAGNDILIHASTSYGATEKLGKFICAKILLDYGNGVFELDKNISATFDNDDLTTYKIQAITFANFHCLKIQQGSLVAPHRYDATKFYGGILAIKCSHSLELNGGHITLSDTGIPVFQKDLLRPSLEQEVLGELDASDRAGEENICKDNIFPLNSGDGAAFIFAKEIISSNFSRIGNTLTHGKIFCRGAKDTPFKPSNTTNIGGSSILIANKKGNVALLNLAKYRNSNSAVGKGLARCYIATSELILGDGNKLLYNEIISDDARVSRDFKLYDFGNGSYGKVENPNYKLNNFIGLRNSRGTDADIDYLGVNGLAAFKVGAKCIVVGSDRKFKIAEVVAIENNCVTFDQLLPKNAYYALTLPEFENLTLTQDYDCDIFAVLVKNKCKISGNISGRCYIFADTLECSGARLGTDRLVLVAKNLSDIDDATLPADNAVYTC